MDFMPKHAGIVLGVCTFVVLAAGCQSSTVLPNQMNRARLDAIEAVRLQVNTVSNTLNVDHQANELNLNIPVAAVTAAQVGAMTTDRDTAAV
ncbi:MAG TPA: hypothetical protein VF267_07300, partial [Gammaproteobacteria bacterium]